MSAALVSLPMPTPRRARVPAAYLCCWIAGDIAGVNHGQTGMGRGRHRTDKAASWSQKVWAAVQTASVRQHCPASVWGVLPDGTGAVAMRLHFYVTGKRLKNGKLRKLDVDAPVKPTLDAAMAGLGLDDACVRYVAVAQTVIEEEAPRPGGYGPTRCGAWVECWRMSRAELRQLALEQPGAPG